MEFLKSALESLPVVASHPFAFVAYIIVVLLWGIIAYRVKRNRQLLKYLNKFPEENRLEAFQSEIGSIHIKEGLTPEQWLKSRRHLYYFLGFSLLCLVIVIIFTISVIYRPLSNLREEDNKQDKENKAWQLLNLRAPGNSGKKWALEYLNNIAKKPLSGINLSSAFNGGKVIINELQIMHADLEGSNFEKVISNKSDFSFSNMSSVNLGGAELNGSKFINANHAFSDLSDANMLSSNLSHANLRGVDFSAANLTDAKLDNTDLSYTKFVATDLSNVDFTNAIVWEIVVTPDTNIKNADLSTVTFPTYVYNSYKTGSDPTEPTPLQCAMSLCRKLRTLRGASTAKLPKRLAPGFECKY